MKVILIAVGALVVGAAIGIALCQATIRYLQRRVRELRKGKASVSILQSVTKLLFVTNQLCALGWVSVSYGIAVYSTVRLRQPFPVVELSQQAITTILGVNVLKVVENIFEHNNGVVFGHSKAEGEPSTQTADEGHERNEL